MTGIKDRVTGAFRLRRSWLFIPADMVCVALATVFSYLLRFNGHIPHSYNHALWFFLFVRTAVYVLFFVVFRMYTRVWRYASTRDVEALIEACLCGAVAVKGIDFLMKSVNLPLSIWLSSFSLTVSFVGGTRLLWRMYARRLDARVSTAPGPAVRTLIYGAGAAGSLIVREVQADSRRNWQIVGFLDDDPNKHGLILNGVRILGGRNDVERVISECRVQQILIAIPSLNRSKLRELVDSLNRHRVTILVMPPYTRWMVDNLASHVRPVDVEDLLGRDPVPVDVQAVGAYLRGAVVLVTGAGGSIGSEICRQVAALSPKQLILLGRGENSIFEIQQELGRRYPGVAMSSVIGDVRDRKKMRTVFDRFRPNVVFHAAAHKHVPLMESHPDEAYLNNVVGTRHLAELAEQYGVERFILISSDKAVHPTNVMGSSKRISEMVLQSLAAEGGPTCFVTVRFGNVLGSRGSVVRIFRQQIAQGGPVTVTDERMVRYFMTIPEAVQLVVQAGSMGESGHVYLLDMGEPVRILDLAERMIRLSGFEPGVDIPIEITGIRPGEKLFEELSRPSDSVNLDTNERIWDVSCPVMPMAQLSEELRRLQALYEAERYGDLAAELKRLAWWAPAADEVAADIDEAGAVAT
ncbi:MAG: polysaccharide biosynthesis protein [Alicyclobacillus sp.]|nr:polysaccharide biosynthesis protein [Alicyclobacillus sp.]